MAWKLPANKRDVYSRLAEDGVIPAGTWKVGAPLLNAQVSASGYTHTNVTTLKYTGWYKGPVISFGQNATSGSGTDSSLPGYAGRFVTGAATASRDVTTITQPSATKALGYYIISDPTITSGGSQGTFQVRRELIYGSGSGTTFTLGRQPTRIVGGGVGQGHTYSDTSYLIDVNSLASYQVSFSNLTIDGNNVANHLMRFWFTDQLTLTQCTFKNFFLEGCSTYFCRNILRDRCHVESSIADTGGEGYCHADYAVYNTETRDCTYADEGLTTRGIRHAHYTAYGVSNKLQTRPSATDTYDEANTPFWEVGAHVGPDNDCKMIDQTHTGIGGGISFGGHQLFGWGSTSTIATNCDANGRDCIVALDSSGTATNVQNMGRIYLIGCYDRDNGAKSPAAGTNPNTDAGPTNFTFDTCEFRELVTSAAFSNNAGAGTTTFFGQHWLGGTITLLNCTNIQTSDAPNWDIRSINNFTLAINGGTYRNTGGTVYRMFDLGNGTAGVITLTLAGNIAFDHQSGGGTREAFRLFGTGSVTNNATITWNLEGSVALMLDQDTLWTGEINDPNP